MNYQKIYDFIIERAKNRELVGYVERHHIIPKCIGGNNKKENIVKLTAKEHYIVHLLLIFIYPKNQKLIYAFWMMQNRIKSTFSSSRIYTETREFIASKMRANVGTKEAIYKMSLSKKGKSSWNGKTHSEESKKKQSESAKTRITTLENETKRRNGISRKLSKKVLQCDLEGNIIKEFSSVSEAAKLLDTYVGSIIHAIQGKRVKKHKGFKWKYKI